MDTVPPYFGCTEDDEFLYGRGTCDAKGIIAAQVAAADRLREAGVKVGLLFVVGEERDSAGAQVANENPKGSKFLINGEPTDNRLALASKGALRVELRAKGRMAHSAYPELGESAIDKLVGALHDVLAMPLPVEPEIGPSTLNIGLIEGGRAPNVIADKAEAHLLIRLVGPPTRSKQNIVEDRSATVLTSPSPSSCPSFACARSAIFRRWWRSSRRTFLRSRTGASPFCSAPDRSTSRIRRTRRSPRRNCWRRWTSTTTSQPACQLEANQHEVRAEVRYRVFLTTCAGLT